MPGITIPGCFFRCAMDGSMVGLVTPLFEPFIQGGQREGRMEKGEKLHSQRFEISFDLSFPFRAVGGTVNERNPKGGGGVGELMRPEGGSVIEINLSGQASLA